MANIYIDNTDTDTFLDEYIKKHVYNETEEILVIDALKRVTSEAVYAVVSDPGFNASAMDGISVHSQNTVNASDVTPLFLKEHTDFEYVNTGDLIESRFDSVIMIEDVIKGDTGIWEEESDISKNESDTPNLIKIINRLK